MDGPERLKREGNLIKVGLGEIRRKVQGDHLYYELLFDGCVLDAPHYLLQQLQITADRAETPSANKSSL